MGRVVYGDSIQRKRTEKLAVAIGVEADAVIIGAGRDFPTSAGFTYSGERF